MSYCRLVALLLLLAPSAQAGDAVVAGYNSKGEWTSVTYYCSGTPKGGADYKDASAARDAALRDLKRRGGEELGKPMVIATSDRTGNFAVARGRAKSGLETIVAGYGKSDADAEADARAKLMSAGATTNQSIMYRYHSYGSDSAGSR